MNVTIENYHDRRHRDQVIGLWKQVFGYQAPHNAPELVIDQKNAFGDRLFFVALDRDKVIGTVMAGYDGHRGWIYSMAVLPEYRKKGAGSRLLAHAENALVELGCLKINLQIVADNRNVELFYRKHGYRVENRISMGKRITRNIGIDKRTVKN